MISTHVLDTSFGRPAADVAVTLERQDGGDWRPVSRAATDADGRVQELSAERVAGTYRLTFGIDRYFSSRGLESFFPFVTIVFAVRNPGEHHHVPLLISPFGYSTYRGS
jgi:5-hydroxyisourate hydrolase